MNTCARPFLAVVLTGIILLSPGIVLSGPDLHTAKAWFDKGMLYREAGDPRATDAFRRAAADMDDVIAAKGSGSTALAKAYTLRARCRNMLGNNDEAVRDLDRAIELSPSDGDLYYIRSFMHEIMGHTELSLADLRSAAQKGNEKAQGELKAKGMNW